MQFILIIIVMLCVAFIAYSSYNLGVSHTKAKILDRLRVINDQFAGVAMTAVFSWLPSTGSESEEKLKLSQQRTKDEYRQLWTNVVNITDTDPVSLDSTHQQKKCD